MPKNTAALFTLSHAPPAGPPAPLGRLPSGQLWKNFLLEFLVQAHPALGTGPSYAGWEVNLRKALPDGDLLVIDEGGTDLRVSEKVSGSWFTRASYTVGWVAGRWYTVRARVEGNTITLWLDGTQVISTASLAVQAPGYLDFNDGKEMDGAHRSYMITRLEVLP